MPGTFLARQPGTDRLLLVVDQFEELATQGSVAADTDRFVGLVLEATEGESALAAVMTLRSDFYTELVKRRDLTTGCRTASRTLAGRTPSAGRRDERARGDHPKPAEKVGLDFDEGLVPRILDDVDEEPGRLPLLEYLLTELWRRRAHGLLTHHAYDELGGVGGAVARRRRSVRRTTGIFAAASPA